MPKTYNEVRDEYQRFRAQFPDDPTDLPSFAQQLDEVQGTKGERAEAYTDAWYKQANAAVDRGFRATGLPEVTGSVVGGLGGLIDSAAGTTIEPTVRRIGEDLPRMLAESLATIPAVASGVGAPAAGAVWANRANQLRKVLGYGSTGLSGYAQTDSPLGAAVNVGAMGLSNKLLLPAERGGVDLAGKAAGALRDRMGIGGEKIVAEAGRDLTSAAPELAYSTNRLKNTAAVVGGIGAEAAAQTGINEATRQAQLSVGPNAVGLTDPARNPVTQENITGNVAGLLPYAPQLAMGARSATGLDTRQLKPMLEWTRARKEETLRTINLQNASGTTTVTAPNAALDKVFGPEVGPEFDLKTEIDRPVFTDKDVAALRVELHSVYDAAMSAKGEGNTQDVQRNLAHAEQLLSSLHGYPDKTSAVAATAETITEARMMAPQSPEGFAEFTKKINGLIETFNKNRKLYEPALEEAQAVLDEGTPVMGLDTSLSEYQKELKRYNEVKTAKDEIESTSKPSARQSWHPNAINAEKIQSLTEKGYIEPITFEWMQRQFNATAADFSDPKTVNDVLAQKAVNHLYDNLPDALRREVDGLPPAESPESASVQAYSEKALKYHEAVSGLPLEIRDAIVNADIQWRTKAPWRDKQGGKTVFGEFPKWMDRVIEAAETYDPVTQMVRLTDGKLKGKSLAGQTVNVSVLTDPDFYPGSRILGVAEDGVGRYQKGGKKFVESSLEDLSSDWTRYLSDEEAKALPASPLSKMHDAYTAALPQIDDTQAWNIVKAATFDGKGAADVSFHQPNARLILEALPNLKQGRGAGITPAGEKLLTAYTAAGGKLPGGTPLTQVQSLLGKLLRQDAELKGVSKMTIDPKSGELFVRNRPETALGRAQVMIEQVLSPRGRDVSKGGGPKAMAAPAEGERPLVRFSGPVRLRRWLASPSMGYAPNAAGEVNARLVPGLMMKLGVTNDEMSIYKAAGLDGRLSEGKVRVEELARWMDEVAPRVEVEKLVPGNGIDKQAGLEHRLETMGYTPIYDDDGNVKHYTTNDGKSLTLEDLPDVVAQVAREHMSFLRGEKTMDSDAATGRYGVEPKELKDMPGAVDILVRVPQKRMSFEQWRQAEGGDATGYKDDAFNRGRYGLAQKETRKGLSNQERELYRGPHFGDSDVNVLASIRGYMETLSSGEKVFHVFEVQSDWGQRYAKDMKSVEAEIAEGNFTAKPYTKNHPLLPVYEQLALKAAVQHARDNGVTKIAISDAETAMMTEGHDRNSQTETVETKFNSKEEARKFASSQPNDAKVEVAENPYDRGNYSVFVTTARSISQEPGMRAAYDTRLPNAMEKLTGKKGTEVNFGLNRDASDPNNSDIAGMSPVFKGRHGGGKNDVTARLYDITTAPDEFTAYGYAKPMAAGDTSASAPAMTDTLTNTTPAGSFAPDVLRTITAAVDRHLGGKGYSGDTRTLYQTAAMAIVRSMEKVPMDFYRIQGDSVIGLADAVDGRGKVGLGVEPTSMETSPHFVHRALTALTHELAHIDDFVHFGGLNAPDAYSEERKRQLTNLRSMFDVLDPEQRKAVLVTLDESLTPPGFRRDIAENSTQLARATQDVEEFSASVMSMVTKSLLFGKGGQLKTALEVLDHSPVEIQEYAQYQYRAIRDILQAAEETLMDPKIRAAAGKSAIATGNPFVLSKAFAAVTASAIEASRVRDGVKDVAAARDMVKAMTEGGSVLPAVETEAVWQRRQRAVEENFGKMSKAGPYAMAGAREAMEMASDALGLRAYGKGQKPGVWARWFYPFANLMHSMERSGVDLAKPLANLVLDTESSVKRRYSRIMSPFMKQETDGSRVWDGDHPLMKSQTPMVRKGVNEVSVWQAENGHTPMFVEVQGQLVPDTAARPVWETMRKKYSLADQQTIISASVAMDRVGQNMALETKSVLEEGLSVRTARLLQMLNKQLPYEQALQQANDITAAFQISPAEVQKLATTLHPKVFNAVANLLGGPDGLVAKKNEVVAMLDSRLGYRTEQLPHDWMVMYKTPEGETKFWSAPDEKRAYWGRDRLAQQGNTPIGEVVNKTDLRSKYQAFDDPDVLLQKFSQVEGRQWEKAVEAVRQGFGPEVADEVAASYTPGAASLQDRGTQGFARFLKGSKSQIDRQSFDYIDAMLARAARLSASASYKTHGGMKDLILNDPRARMFPTLQNMVNDHWDNMLSPTSDLTKKVKALATGYYLGANLSSAAVEGTQSVMTVVPALIASNAGGGPMKAYRQLASAIADTVRVSTTKDWQQLVQSGEAALKANPSAVLTRDQTQAMMYHRAKADGIIGHGAVEDLLFSRDARTLQTAKFGEGEYGPVSMASLAGNKLYLGAQMLTGIYSMMSKFNDKISFFAGLNQGIEKKLTGDDLYNHARQFKTLATFGGGKANAPGWVTQAKTPFTRSAVGMVNTLQQYGYGMVAMYGQFAKDSIDASKSLDPAQRRQARKAFGTMLATQVAVGGALGVPFAGASLTLIEKLFGVPANQLVREGLASLGGDEDEGGVIAETALNGLGNQMFGLDVSSRLGVTNLLGTSAYRGFAVQDLLGPVPGMVANAVKGLNWFGQGEPIKAAHALVPAAFKNVLSMADSHAKYGDYAIRDSSENLLYTPTDAQNTARAFGFRSREESQKRQATMLTSGAEERVRGLQDREGDAIARKLLQGDSDSARLYARSLRDADPATSESDVLRGVMERAVRMTQEKDLLAGGSRRGADERARIVGTFASDVNTRRSETEAMRLRMQLAARLGAPDLMPDGKALQRAAVVDGIVQSQGVPRSQALAMVKMMGL